MRCDGSCRRGQRRRPARRPAHSRRAPSCRDRCCSKHFTFGSLKRLRGEPFAFYKLCSLAERPAAGTPLELIRNKVPVSGSAWARGRESGHTGVSVRHGFVPVQAPGIRRPCPRSSGPWTSWAHLQRPPRAVLTPGEGSSVQEVWGPL